MSQHASGSPRARKQVFRKQILVVLTLLLGACASQPRTLYHWDTYQNQVYAYLKDSGGDQAAQIAQLEAGIEKARAAGQPLPPGYRAHLGMLYGNAGHVDDMKQQFDLERQAFPESAAFLDFLLGNLDKQGGQP